MRNLKAVLVWAFLSVIPMFSAFAQDLMPEEAGVEDNLSPVLSSNPIKNESSTEISPPSAESGEIESESPPPPEGLQDMKVAVLETLDKITARVGVAEIPVGERVRLGSLYMIVQSCRKSSPEDRPEAAAFLQIWEAREDMPQQSVWVYSGWMYASSPALAAMDHPVYDVWIKDCKMVSSSPH